MNGVFERRGFLYAFLLIAFVFAGVKAIEGLAKLRSTIDQSPQSFSGYDGYRPEVEFTRLLDGLTAYVAGVQEIDLDEVTARFDILWSRCQLLIKGQAFEAMREHAGIGEVSGDLLKVLQEIDDDVSVLERGDLTTLSRIRKRLAPFEAALAGMTTRVADLEMETRASVSDATRQSLAILDRLALTVGLIVMMLLSFFGFEAVHARRVERQLASYQEHLEQLVAERTDELQR